MRCSMRTTYSRSPNSRATLLRRRGYDDTKIQLYMSRFNTLSNLQILTDSENTSKNATPFDEWLKTRDVTYRSRHLIPDMADYSFGNFEEFFEARRKSIVAALKAVT